MPLLRKFYRCEADGSRQPYLLYVPERRSERSPLVLLLHGFGGNEHSLMKDFLFEEAEKRGVFLLSPRGRGNTFYDGPGEDDVLSVLRRTMYSYPIERERVYLMGASMGGTGAWRLGTRFPDLFAGLVPVCGWTDWRLWYRKWYASELHPKLDHKWRITLLERASALPFAYNLVNLPTLIMHGGRDDVVDVKESRRMFKKLLKAGAPVVYKEYSRSGHSGFLRKWGRALDWFEGKYMSSWLDRPVKTFMPSGVLGVDPLPQRVVYVTNSMRYPGAYWLRVSRLEEEGKMGNVEATFEKGTVRLRASGIKAVEIHHPGHREIIVGRRIIRSSAHPTTLVLTSKGWEEGEPAQRTLHKRFGLTGPIVEVFRQPFTIVPGEGKGDIRYAEYLGLLWRKWLIAPLSRWRPPIKRSHDLTQGELRGNLILVDSTGTHPLLQRLKGNFPFEVGRGYVRIGKKSFPGCGMWAIHPSPLSYDAYVLVMHRFLPLRAKDLECLPWLLPDFVVFDPWGKCSRLVHPQAQEFYRALERGEVESPERADLPPLYLPDLFEESGFFDEQWRPPSYLL